MAELNIYPGITGAFAAEDVDPFGRLKIAIVGRVKVGKSWLTSTAPAPIYVFDFDGRKESLAGKAGVQIKTYKDDDPSNPKALNQFEQDLSMFEYLAKNGKPIPSTFVLDSATWWEKAAKNDLIKNYSNLRRSIKIGGKERLIAQGWDVFTAVTNHMENAISRLAALGNVIVVFHEEPEKDKTKSTPDTPVYTGAYSIHPFYLRNLLSTFNETWRLEIKNSEYIVQVQPSNSFGASTTMKLDKTEKPDIMAMIEKHKKAVGKGV